MLPTDDELLAAIASAVYAELDEPRASFPVYRDKDSVWVRSADDDEIIRITVERLPREAWPPFPEL